MSLIRRIVGPGWPVWAAFAAAALLAIAHGFETFGHLAPCELCLKQRTVYWAALAVGLVGYGLERLLPGRRIGLIVCSLLAVVFLYQAGLAGYHSGVEWKWWPGPQSCTGTGKVNVGDLTALLNGAKISGPSCDKAAWRMIGLSMAGWNALVALGLAGLSAAAALLKEPARGSNA